MGVAGQHGAAAVAAVQLATRYQHKPSYGNNAYQSECSDIASHKADQKDEKQLVATEATVDAVSCDNSAPTQSTRKHYFNFAEWLVRLAWAAVLRCAEPTSCCVLGANLQRVFGACEQQH
jgi:hypothetical protein